MCVSVCACVLACARTCVCMCMSVHAHALPRGGFSWITFSLFRAAYSRVTDVAMQLCAWLFKKNVVCSHVCILYI